VGAKKIGILGTHYWYTALPSILHYLCWQLFPVFGKSLPGASFLLRPPLHLARTSIFKASSNLFSSINTMKLVIVGSTGLVAAEVIRRALSAPTVTSIIGLARRETPVPSNLGPNADTSKLKSAIIADFENYSDDVKQQVKGADACIW
jgi:hypothetical protein